MTEKSVVIVGGGFSGALFGLKLHRARPDWRVVVVEPTGKLGRGIAYGACGPQHLLNVPVVRMEVGLTPSFSRWLEPHCNMIADALIESGQDLSAAFVPRHLFGDYMEERVKEALSPKSRTGLTAVRGEAVRLLNGARGVLLTDGREIRADFIVLAMGNLPPRPPRGPDSWLYDTGFFIPNPWAPDALSNVAPEEPLLLIGSGLTMVDLVSRLSAGGHYGPLLAISRRGLKPRQHKSGGIWPEFLHDRIPASPLALTRLIRAEIARAESHDIPWQRVFDATRPAVAAIWSSWDDYHRRQFLRHLRPRWDIHRHRTAPRVGNALDTLLADGKLEILAGTIAGYQEADMFVDVALKLRGGVMRNFRAGHIVNCTGPGSDFDKIAIPLVADLRDRKLAVPDALGVGFQTRDCGVLDAMGNPSSWLFALGPLTRPAWWEITAVPEINLQIERLVSQITSDSTAQPLSTEDFWGMGEGI